jgi:hypothetical protein
VRPAHHTSDPVFDTVGLVNIEHANIVSLASLGLGHTLTVYNHGTSQCATRLALGLFYCPRLSETPHGVSGLTVEVGGSPARACRLAATVALRDALPSVPYNVECGGSILARLSGVVLSHPFVVEDLGEVLDPVITQQGHDRRTLLRCSAAVRDDLRSAYVEAGGAANKHAGRCGCSALIKGVKIVDAHGAVDEAQGLAAHLHDVSQRVLPCALDLHAACRLDGGIDALKHLRTEHWIGALLEQPAHAHGKEEVHSRG